MGEGGKRGGVGVAWGREGGLEGGGILREVEGGWVAGLVVGRVDGKVWMGK